MREPMSNTGLVATNAGANIVGASIGHLVDEVGVANKRARHSDHVRLTRIDHLLGKLWLIDAPRHQHWLVDCLFQAGGIIGNKAMRDRHRGEHVDPSMR